jgi:NAD(P)-dependent dehydrogenase (short-subunit alcohol dehydrogenase family)
MSSQAVVVTGGTGALGSVVVAKLLAEGRKVAVPFRDRSGWDRLRPLAGDDRLFGATADPAEPAAMEAFAAQAEARLGALAGLAHLAGAFSGSPQFEQAPLDEWDRMLRANLVTAYATCRAVVPRLKAGGGSVVLVASKLVETGGAGAAAYTVSKAGVIALARALAAENPGVLRVNCLLPGIIDTAANRAAMPAADRSVWTSPEAIADIVAFLMSPRSGALSGAVLPLAGASVSPQSS